MPASSVTIRHNDVVYNISIDFDDESILDAALFEGVNLPYSCKKGICGTCRAKLLEGQVEMDVHIALGHGQISQGWILACQSKPTTDRVFIDFDAE